MKAEDMNIIKHTTCQFTMLKTMDESSTDVLKWKSQAPNLTTWLQPKQPSYTSSEKEIPNHIVSHPTQ